MFQSFGGSHTVLPQALNGMRDLPPNSLTVVLHHNMSVLTGLQNRMPDALVNMRTYQVRDPARFEWLLM